MTAPSATEQYPFEWNANNKNTFTQGATSDCALGANRRCAGPKQRRRRSGAYLTLELHLDLSDLFKS